MYGGQDNDYVFANFDYTYCYGDLGYDYCSPACNALSSCEATFPFSVTCYANN